MKARAYNRWKCQLLGNNGKTAEVTLTAYWDPEKVTNDSVAQAAAAQETVKAKHQPAYQGLAAALITD